MNSVQSINGTGYYNQVHGHNKTGKNNGIHKHGKPQQLMNKISQGASSFGFHFLPSVNNSQGTSNSKIGNNLNIMA